MKLVIVPRIGKTIRCFCGVNAASILRDLVAACPKSNRSGCAVLELAHLASGEAREHYLREAIANPGEAWCEAGVQVGALARARLVVYYADLEQLDEAERLAKELVVLFPGAIDESGALLDDVLRGVRLLRQEVFDQPANTGLHPSAAVRDLK